MAVSINNNLMALMAANNLTRSYNMLQKSVQALSSGLRINGAADDAAGLAVRELMRSDIAVLNQGVRNANDAISMLQTMDGAAAVIDEKLVRMKELAEQAATGTYNNEQRSIMHQEFSLMREEIDRIAESTDFNGIKLLNRTSGGTAATFQTLQTTEDDNTFAATNSFINAFTNYSAGETLIFSWATNNGTTSTMDFAITDDTTINSVITWINAGAAAGSNMTASWSAYDGFQLTDQTSGVSQANASFLGGASYSFNTLTAGADPTTGPTKIHFGTGNDSDEDYYYIQGQDLTETGLNIDTLSIENQHSAQASLTAIDAAILEKDTARANFGAIINRLENTVTNLTIQAENIQAAESQISDADVAFEMTKFMNTQIKTQAAVAMLAQANSLPQMALTLLQGG